MNWRGLCCKGYPVVMGRDSSCGGLVRVGGILPRRVQKYEYALI